MYNFSGITYRLWAVCGFLALIGVLCLLFAWHDRGKTKNRDTWLAGVLGLVWALCLGVHYGNCIHNPQIEVYHVTFESVYRDSRVAPPLPLTFEYTFRDEEGNAHAFYLDALAKKEIFCEELTEGAKYTVTVEGRSSIILQIE